MTAARRESGLDRRRTRRRPGLLVGNERRGRVVLVSGLPYTRGAAASWVGGDAERRAIEAAGSRVVAAPELQRRGSP